MDNRQLSYFRAVYERRSFTKAAESIFISPQGINKAVHQLESELGVPLFEQTAIGLSPTVYGQYLYTQSGPYVKQHKDILTGLEELRSRNTMTMTIRMAMGKCDVLPPCFFTDFMRLHPEIHIHFFSYSDDECNQILHTTNDSIGLCTSSRELEGYECIYSRSHRLFLIVGQTHPFAGRKTIYFRELKGENLLNISFSNTQEILRDWCGRLGITPQNILTVADRNLTMDLIVKGLAVSFHAGDFYKKFPICRVDFEDFEDYLFQRIFVPKNKLDNPAVKLFVQYVHDRLDNIPAHPESNIS